MKLPNCNINLEKVLQMEGLVHTYLYDHNNIATACNKSQKEFFIEVFQHVDPIGLTPYEWFKTEDKSLADIIVQEHSVIRETGIPQQFYNSLNVKGYRLNLLTTKIPLYDAQGKFLGILGISNYLQKFSAPAAFKLGLSKREVDCLYLLLQGKVPKEIAAILNLSTRTVEKYLENMKAKLNCHSNTELKLKSLQNEIKQDVEHYGHITEEPHRIKQDRFAYSKAINNPFSPNENNSYALSSEEE
ncbi:MAG: helix-turn-helix transcriptional regulator [Nitrososphaerales archaeon]